MLDYIILLAYFAMLIVCGIKGKKQVKDANDAMTAGKGLNMFKSIMGKAATSTSGTVTVGTSAYGYTMGIGALWWSASSISMNVAISVVAKRVKLIADKFGFLTLGDFLEYRYGKATRIISAIVNIVTYIGFGVSQIIATAVILQALTGLDFKVAAVGSTIIIIAYSVMGGMHSIILADIVQVFLIYIGIICIALPLTVHHLGGFSNFWAQLPENMTNIWSMGALDIIAILLANFLGAFVLQAAYQMAIAAKDGNIARTSTLWGAVVAILPELACLFLGMMAFVMFPGIDGNNAIGSIMTNVLPIGASGMLMAAVIAATMSSSSSFAMAGAMSFVNDIYRKYINPNAGEKKELLVTRLAMVGSILLSLIVAMFFQNIVSIILWVFTFACGALLMPVLGCMYWKRATNTGALLSIAVGGPLHIILSVVGTPIPVIFITVPIAAAVFIIGSLLSKPNDPEKIEEFFFFEKLNEQEQK